MDTETETSSDAPSNALGNDKYSDKIRQIRTIKVIRAWPILILTILTILTVEAS